MFNSCFDIRVVKNTLGIDLDCYWDAWLGYKLLDEVQEAGLKEIHTRIFGETDDVPFTYQALFGALPFTVIPINTAYLYAAGDGIKTWDVFKWQEDQFKSKPKPFYVFKEIEMPTIKATVELEENGIHIDKSTSDYLVNKYTSRLPRM